MHCYWCVWCVWCVSLGYDQQGTYRPVEARWMDATRGKKIAPCLCTCIKGRSFNRSTPEKRPRHRASSKDPEAGWIEMRKTL